MKLDILCNGQVLRRLSHNDQIFAEAPPVGEYTLRLTNDSPNTRLAIVSVDGINVISGKDAGYEGGGFVLRPWETLPIKGWMRSHQEVAAFTFQAVAGSYAAATGRGTKNTGVIGIAVFDEQPKPTFTVRYEPRVIRERIIEHHYPQFGGLPSFGGIPTFGGGHETTCSVTPRGRSVLRSAMKGIVGSESVVDASYSAERSSSYTPPGAAAAAAPAAEAAQEIGTGYGQALTQHTRSVEFVRSTPHPILVLQIRYATKETLRAWGVPVDAPAAAPAPNAFPAAPGFAQPPAGWTGAR